jgi:hypothetical protein
MPTADQLAGLNVALNEARILSLDFDLIRRAATIELSILTLPEEGPTPADARIELRLFPVGRVAASLASRDGKVTTFGIEQLSEIAATFGSQPIYGWEFFDPPSQNVAACLGRLSLDFRAGATGMTHTLHLFQENAERRFDVCFWFDELEVRAVDGQISLDTLIAGGKRWWDAVFAGDPRTAGSGIQPLKKQ